MTAPHDGDGDDRRTRDDRRTLAVIMHTAFFVLLGASLARFLLRHPGEPRTPWVVALSVLLAALYVLGPALGARLTARRLAWLAAVVAGWAVLVVLAPSFAWSAVPLFYTGLRTLPARAAVALVALLTALAVAAQLELAGWADPNVLLAPPAVAAVATAVFVAMERQAHRQRELIDDLVRTRRDLAATERREGTLAERERLAREIHDTLAQGLSSQRMLLQAADRVWESDPAAARTHVRTAASIAESNLAEARRFVHDLTPADLAGGGGLEQALRAVADRESSGTLTVRVHTEGSPAAPLPALVESALLRIAQGALANVREHAGASTATVTLTCLDDQIVLDVADDGRGFDPADPRGTGAATAPSAAGRGHGLPAIRARLRQLGGTLTVESAPGEGTVVSAAIPLEPPS
ncbi:sensor histidine kinase [Streptomyces griseosporeus]|uniref:sensor histidine kinase n=1 Tax=Streptomyces griseosporeus TaxID=1910 RepID=UPI00167EE61F|nr:sensor histidine kinase [Streptomyces griseosporeus]GHF72516.1 two-component sensor histidine kinase [Streptomyces griseosporeus]